MRVFLVLCDVAWHPRGRLRDAQGCRVFKNKKPTFLPNNDATCYFPVGSLVFKIIFPVNRLTLIMEFCHHVIRCIWHVWSCTLRLTFTMLQNTENAIAVWQSGLSSCVFQQNILHTNCTLWMDNDLNIQFLRDKVPMVVRCFGSKFLPMCDSLRGWVATLAYLFA